MGDYSAAMKFPGAEILSCLALLVAAAPAASNEPAAAAPAQLAPPTVESSIESLIAELANESFAVRENASKRLWEHGDDAIRQLKEAATGTDPEAAYRARDLLRKIDLFITPGTDPAVIRLIERYKKAALSEKADLLDALREKRAYRQILKLYAAETQPKLRELLQPMVEGLARTAARECLLAGDPKGARVVLEMAPADANGLLALAAFHRANGTLDAELARAQTSSAKGAKAWQLALYRAAGRIPEARAAAAAAGESAVAASMALLAGDPVPWLEYATATGGERTLDLYSPLALKRWNGETLGNGDLEPLVRALTSRNSSSRRVAFSALFLLGQTAAAEPVLAKLSPLDAFSYFEAEERIPEAFAALGLDPEKPDFSAWVATRFERLTSDPDESKSTSKELVIVASFLESRCLDDALAGAYDKPLIRLADKDLDTFTGLIGDLSGKLFPRIRVSGPLLRVARQWAGDDNERWEKLLLAAFGDDSETLAAWGWLAQLKPAATRQQRLAAMVAMAGYGADPDHLRQQWLDLAWAAITQAEPARKTVLLKYLQLLVTPSMDVETLLKIHDLSPPTEEPAESEGRLLLHLSATNRWADAAKVIFGLFNNEKRFNDEQRSSSNARPELHAYAAACLRRAGKEDEAAEHDGWVEKLALGDADDYRRIAQGYAFGDDYDRSLRWLRRAACEAEPGGDDFDLIIDSLASELLDAGQWAQAAAFSEALAQGHSQLKYGSTSEQLLLRVRLQADLAHALSLLEQDRPRALRMLETCHSTFKCDGLLADSFFPALRSVGLIKEHDAWFETTWQHMQEAIQRYPASHNTRNSAAWLAARAMRHLDEGEAHLRAALATHPQQAAYLDTMAELQFARGRREEALKWSQQSINFMPSDSAIRRQYHRFLNDPLPK